jgi:hypothetical protein
MVHMSYLAPAAARCQHGGQFLRAGVDMNHAVGPSRYPKLKLRLCDSRIIHTQKYCRTGSSLQSSSDQVKYFLGRLSPIFIVLGDWLPRLTGRVTCFRCLTSHNDILLLCRHPILALEFEPPTPRITKVRARTHSTLEPLTPPRSSGLPNTAERRYKSRAGQPHIS